ncbi:hypothetical protein MKW92_037735 [Papaver armeniacum]|nr:hypothetical protein MKW92_037735 [Papaver armeniacum]
MVKHRDKDAGCNESSDNDDFVKPHKKMKTSKKCGKPKTINFIINIINPIFDVSTYLYTNSTKPFRANFGPLYDLFRDLENKGLLLTKEMIKALEATPFRDMIRVFVYNKISKDELCKSNHGLEMLIHTFTKIKMDKMNGIENKLINERKVTPSTNDLCIRYKFGETSPPVVRSTEVQVAIVDAIKNGRVEDFVRLVVFYILPCNYLIYVKSLDVINRISWPHLIHNYLMESIESSKGDVKRITGCTFYLLYWFAEHSSLVQRRAGAETIVPRFARWDAWSISNAITVLEKLPYKLSDAGIFEFGHSLTIPLDVVERKLINPIKQLSRLETEQEKVMNLEKENVALIIEKEELIKTQRGILGRFRSERNRLVAKSKRLKVDVKREIYKVMEETLDEIFKSLDEKSRDREQVQEHDDQPQRMEAPQEEYDIGPDEYGKKHRTQKHLFRGDTAEDGSGLFSLGLTQYLNEQGSEGDDVADFASPEKGPRMKKNNEVHVSSLVRGVKTRSSRPEKGIGADFTPEGRGNKKESKPVQTYKHFENLKLYKHMKKGDIEALQPYFKRTTPSYFAWRLIDHDGGVSFSILGAHVQDLVDNGFLEGELLEYYMYKLDLKQKEAQSQMQDSQDPGKYAKYVFMRPGALELLQSNDEDGVNEYIRDFILRIPDDPCTGRYSTSISLTTVGSTTIPCRIFTPKRHARLLRNS